MDLEKARDFIRQNHSGVLCTYRADGRPQMSPVGAAVDDEGRVAISSRETAYKVKNLRRDPRVSVLVTKANSWEWVQVDGTATTVSLPDAMEPLVDLLPGGRRASTPTGTTTGRPWSRNAGWSSASTSSEPAPTVPAD